VVEYNFLRSVVPVSSKSVDWLHIFDIIKIVRFCGFDIFHEIFVDRATLRTYCHEDWCSFGRNIAKYLKEKTCYIFGQARFDEHRNFISVGFEDHSVMA
jgi:hypothetical protein